MPYEIQMKTKQEVEENFYKLRDDIQVQIRAYKALRGMCVDESQFMCIEHIDKELERFNVLNKHIAANPIVTEGDLKKWRKELNSLIDRLMKIYKEHKQYQFSGEVAI